MEIEPQGEKQMRWKFFTTLMPHTTLSLMLRHRSTSRTNEEAAMTSEDLLNHCNNLPILGLTSFVFVITVTVSQFQVIAISNPFSDGCHGKYIAFNSFPIETPILIQFIISPSIGN